MLPEHYEIRIGSSSNIYLFESKGAKGTIEKAVVLSETNLHDLYNLGFGDVLPNGQIDDFAVSDNGDMQKVLATIASVVVDFTYKNPQAMVVAAGSTPARTRLYRMGITSHYDLLAMDFNVYGFFSGAWEHFTRGKDYEAFYVKRKQ